VRILVVDHDPRGREVLVQRMRGRGFEIDSAQTAAEAIDLMTMARYDFVLLEVVMPHDAFAAITSWMGQTTAPPRIIITSGIAELWRRANPEVKIAGVLQKPFTMEELLLVIGAAQRVTPAPEKPRLVRKTLDC
jgi:DNA-binding response OmpR family regulator